MCVKTVALIGRLNSVVDRVPAAVPQRHTHRDYNGESLAHGCHCIVDAVPLWTDVAAARLSGCFCEIKNNAPLDRRGHHEQLIRWSRDGLRSGWSARVVLTVRTSKRPGPE